MKMPERTVNETDLEGFQKHSRSAANLNFYQAITWYVPSTRLPPAARQAGSACRCTARLVVSRILHFTPYAAPLAARLTEGCGRGLTDDLAVNRAIRPIAGATLTARAASEAVRRVLAIDQVIGGTGQ